MNRLCRPSAGRRRGAACAYFFDVGLSHAEPLIGRLHVVIRLALSLTALCAVMWEFLSDVFLGSHLNLGVSDTLSDLFFGIFGATVLVVISAVRYNVAKRETSSGGDTT